MLYNFLDKDTIKNPPSVYHLGYTFFGPLVFNYFKWLIENLNESYMLDSDVNEIIVANLRDVLK